MESLLLNIHNLLRWGIVLAGLFAVYRAFVGYRQKREYTHLDNRSSLIFTLFVHLQIVLGLLMYFIGSSMTGAAIKNFGAAMKNSDLRFWALEHPLMMIIAAVLVTMGRSKSKRAQADIDKHKKAFWFFLIALVLILAMTPWPFGAHPRPWFPF